MAKHKVYTFYAELNDYEPKIWRRFEINGEKTIAELSYAIMIMFEMQASHLFTLTQYFRDAFKVSLLEQFSEEVIDNMIAESSDMARNIHYEFPIGDVFLKDDERLVEPDTILLQSAVSEAGMKFLLEYDYGDGWEVSLLLESIREEDISLSLLPRVIEGERYGIVEDVEGTSGLTHLAEVLKRGAGDEYENYTNWLDSTTLDLESFDREDTNFRLKKNHENLSRLI